MRQRELLTHFDRTTQVHRRDDADAPDGEAVFAAELDETWASLLGVHGGYVSALAVRAAEALESMQDREVRSVSATFLRPTRVGPAEIVVETLRHGRSFSTVSARVRQQGRDAMVARITLLTPVVGNDWSRATADRPAPLASCTSFTPPPQIKHFAQAELRIDPAFVPTGTAGDARVAGHVRPLDARPLDAAWLTMIGDWFPPSPFRRLAPPTGGVSIDYAVHVHRTLPPDPDLWLEGVFEAANSVGGIALERGTLATPDGLLVAETFHTRWTG